VNKKGGEKRLNVLFSRARKHMSVVSSIRYEQITNEYNEGASYFRRFLQYAELVSSGQMGAARTVLDGLITHQATGDSVVSPTIVREQLKEQLVRLGYEVAGPIGQSDFKCSLAVKKNPADDDYALAILIDDEGHYRNDNLIEQYYQRPAILLSFGWKVLSVYAKDWLHRPQKVLEQVLKALGDSGIGGKSTGVTGTGAAKAGAYDHLVFRRLVRGEHFWEGATDGPRLIVRWGKTGARGQIRLVSFSNETAALGELDRLENEQKEKGYA
jgi:predicted DNA-binding WGR domain protein